MPKDTNSINIIIAMKKKPKRKTSNSQSITFQLNGKAVSCEVNPSVLLLDLLREHFGLKGAKPGCREGECGACTVLLDGMPINSCLFLAINADGKKITTIEGLTKDDGSLDLVQHSLVQHGAVQCGFCTSGMALSIKGLKNKHAKKSGKKITSSPDREEIKKYLEGNLCRCTGYVKIIDAAEQLFKKEA